MNNFNFERLYSYSTSYSIFSDSQPIERHMENFFDHNLKYNCSFKAMESMAKIINTTPNAAVFLPNTKYKIKKELNPIFNHQFQIRCSTCKNYMASSKSATKCMICDVPISTGDSDHFLYIPIKQQLEHSMAKNLEEILNYNSHVLSANELTDIHSGKIFKNAQAAHPNCTILPLIVNTDGVKMFKHSNKSLWLIQICPAYMPPNVRYKHTMVVAAHFALKKPKMAEFFYPLLKDMSDIHDSGGIVINQGGKSHTFLPLIISACCDLPAKADLQGNLICCGMVVNS